jgi:hypothetical protein
LSQFNVNRLLSEFLNLVCVRDALETSPLAAR